MSGLDLPFSKWHRVGSGWAPALWPLQAMAAASSAAEPTAPPPVTPPAWVPYPPPRPTVLERARLYVSSCGKERLDPLSIDCRGLGRVGFAERRSSIRLVVAERQRLVRALLVSIPAIRARLLQREAAQPGRMARVPDAVLQIILPSVAEVDHGR